MKFDPTKRINALILFSVLFAGVLISRLFMVQVVRGEEFSRQADSQYSKPSSDIFSRGSIYFQEKSGNLVSAAGLRINYIISMNPAQMDDPEKTYEAVSSVASTSKAVFMAKAGKKDDPYEEIFKTSQKSEAGEIESLGLPELGIFKEKYRFYPAGRLASHVLGFVGRVKEEGDKYAGRYGLEKFYEDVLARDKESVYTNFFAELFSNIKTSILSGGEKLTGDIVTNIEPTVENALAKELSIVSEKWKGRETGGVIMDPKTGKIIALSALPDFDPGNFGAEKGLAVYRNSLVENVYEMGSIMKPLTVSAGIDAGVITPETTYFDKGFVELNGKRIENYDGKGNGKVTIQTALGKSLNTGMVFVMQTLGKDKFTGYMNSFGLGEKTGIDLPGEIAGLTKNLSSKYEVDYATAAFGQGIAVTPIAMASALSAIANGGVLMKPTLVNKINYRVGVSEEIKPEEIRRVIKAKTSEEVTRMLVEVCDKDLLGGTVKLKNYSVAAKTGTAQLTDGKGGYYDDKFLHSFFGYFPAYHPEFLILLYTVDPQGVEYASHSLTEPFMNLAKFLISYYEIPPDR